AATAGPHGIIADANVLSGADMTRVLITGITGMVGSHLAEYLLNEQKGIEVFGVKRWRSSLANINHIKDQITLIDCDLTDASGVLTVVEAVKP
ncbi:GDP-mannose 4,6-dehydratase, partial [Streptomyces galilaeus]|uniref:GDP-mannose 4,6-dehydratase n=1 Tax=Streptomyces galilaeus TaxID=33899 RepID=UPI0038F77FB5